MTTGQHHEFLRAEYLTTDPKVQRPLDERRAQRMALDFIPGAIGSIVVSRRADGTNVIIDGAHRTRASVIANHSKPLPCVVHNGLSKAEEAALFLRLNDTRQPQAISKYLVSVVEGNKEALALEAILASHGWRVDASDQPGNLAAIDALRRVYRNAGGVLPDGQYDEITDRVITIITRAWERDSKSANAAILLGLAQLLGRFGGTVDADKLVKEMAQTRPLILVGKAKALRDIQNGVIPAAMAKVLSGMHNNHRRINLLPEWVWTH